MIKVTTRQRIYPTTGSQTEEIKVIEHKKGMNAQVYNGVLTIYTDVVDKVGALGIAGYMPDAWIRWELV